SVSVAEKGVLWVRLVATGPAGHGSTPIPGRAPDRLVSALDRIRARAPEPVVHPALYTLLRAAADDAGGFPGFVLARPFLANHLGMGKLLANPATRAVVTNTANVTGFGGAFAPNVVPSEVWAQVDARVLPGTTPDEMKEELRRVVDDDQVRI